LRRSCELGDRRACRDAAFTYRDGRKDLPADLAIAASLHRRGCELGDAVACWLLGRAYEDGKGIAKDETQAAALFQKACDGGSSAGCQSLASAYMFRRGLRWDEAKERAAKARTLELEERACANDSPLDCDSVALDDPAQSAAMKGRALQIMQEGCSAGEVFDCWEVARRLKSTDPDAAKTATERACGLAWTSDCGDAGAPDAGTGG
jgi:TPR repeat protein